MHQNITQNCTLVPKNRTFLLLGNEKINFNFFKTFFLIFDLFPTFMQKIMVPSNHVTSQCYLLFQKMPTNK